MAKYAAGTRVTTDRSRAEIERTLARYGATAFGYMWQGQTAIIVFEMRNRRIRFTLAIPEEKDFRYTPTHIERSIPTQRKAWEQAKLQRWRSLALYVKATCEAIEAGIIRFEDAWLSATVLPSGATVGEWLEPQIDGIYHSGQMPSLLPAPTKEPD